jgi:hypothetical protein
MKALLTVAEELVYFLTSSKTGWVSYCWMLLSVWCFSLVGKSGSISTRVDTDGSE